MGGAIHSTAEYAVKEKGFRNRWGSPKEISAIAAFGRERVWRTTMVYSKANPGPEDTEYGEFILESDAPWDQAHQDLCVAYDLLTRGIGIDPRAIFFSFTGHKSPYLHVHPAAFDAGPRARLRDVYRSMAEEVKGWVPYASLDLSIYKHRQLVLAMGSYDGRTRRYCIPLTKDEFFSGKEKILDIAKSRRVGFPYPVSGRIAATPGARAWFERHLRSVSGRPAGAGPRRRPGGGLRPCVKHLLERGAPEGFRNEALYGLSLAMRDCGVPEAQWQKTASGWYRGACPQAGADSDRQILATVHSAYKKDLAFSCSAIRQVLEGAGAPVARLCAGCPLGKDSMVRVPREWLRGLLASRAPASQCASVLNFALAWAGAGYGGEFRIPKPSCVRDGAKCLRTFGVRVTADKAIVPDAACSSVAKDFDYVAYPVDLVLKAGLLGASLVTLLAITSAARRHGCTYYSSARTLWKVAALAGRSLRTVQRHLRRLRETGAVSFGGRGATGNPPGVYPLIIIRGLRHGLSTLGNRPARRVNSRLRSRARRAPLRGAGGGVWARSRVFRKYLGRCRPRRETGDGWSIPPPGPATASGPSPPAGN